MKKPPFISFIIPIYNTKVEKIDNCLKSICRIRKIDYEIILMNDGSEDNYTEQYLKLIHKFTNINYKFEENSGVSYARNKGISLAKGKYIFFVDSDDTIDDLAFTENTGKLQDDLIIFNVTVKDANKIKNFNLNFDDDSLSKNQLLRAAIKNGLINWSSGKLYKTQILRRYNLLFNTSKKTGEDLDFVVRFILKSKNIKYLSLNSYFYFLDKNTSYSRYKKYPLQIIDDSFDTYKLRKKLVEKYYSKKNREKERQFLEEDLVHSLFNVYLLDQTKSPIVYTEITNILSQLVYKKKYHLTAKIRIYILYHNNRFLLNLYSLMFSMYTKFRKQ